MRARPLVATLRRLDKVESTLFTDTGERRTGVMRVPPILPLGEWEALAVPTLQALALAAAQDIDRHEAQQPHKLARQLEGSTLR